MHTANVTKLRRTQLRDGLKSMQGHRSTTHGISISNHTLHYLLYSARGPISNDRM